MFSSLASLLLSLFPSLGPVLRAQNKPQDLGALPARRSVDWLRSGVIYEIDVRTFSRAGTLNGVTEQLDRLQKLGATILWLMPIQPNGQVKKKGRLGSPYSIRDYYAIDPQFGSKGDLKRLIKEAHSRGQKVILDMVANHTAWDSVMMAHPEFYKHNAQGEIIAPHDWDDVAALNYENAGLRQYMLDLLKYWVKEFDIDGYRCDVAFEVPTDFWEQARRELEQIKPDFMMLAEASKPELLRSAFDIDYSWPLLKTLNRVMMQGEPATAVRDVIEEQKRLFPKGALHMRMSDDHDEERAIARYGTNGALAASALMFTLDGVPMLYSGMEVGDSTESGGPALFEAPKVIWQMRERRPEFAAFYQAMIPFRRQHEALRDGELIWVHNSDERRIVTFRRRTDKEELLIALNLSNIPFSGTVETEGMKWAEALPKSAGTPLPALSLGPFGWRIFLKQ